MEKNDTNKHDETNYQTKLQQRSKNYNSNRRGKNKMKYNSHNMKIIHSNIDGFISKQESLQDIIQSEKPDILTLNATALKGKRKVKIDNYTDTDYISGYCILHAPPPLHGFLGFKRKP